MSRPVWEEAISLPGEALLHGVVMRLSSKLMDTNIVIYISAGWLRGPGASGADRGGAGAASPNHTRATCLLFEFF